MVRSKSSKRWLKEHFDDEYVQKAQQQGFRSRAVYKLEEIDTRDQLLKPGMTIVDLGAAPGGWTQWASQRVGGKARIFALDILPMDPFPDVHIIEGDFREESVLRALLDAMGDARADLVMSDMAPNMSGQGAVDQPRSMYLAELSLELVARVANPGANYLVKVFQGAGSEAFLRDVRAKFATTRIRKPAASRSRSREVYYVGLGFKG